MLLPATLVSIVLLPACWRVRRAFATWVAVPPAPAPAAGAAPIVSVLVPARNEVESIERCVTSLLAQRYPADRVRMIVVDDQSTDGTGAVLHRLAATDTRLRVVRGEPLPTGWIGKAWALDQASRLVDPNSTWLLLTDADTVHAPNALASAVRFATERQLDLLSLATGQDLGSFPEKVLLPVILGLALSVGGSVDQVNDPTRPDVAKANGQYLLIRARAYAALGGHAALRRARVEDFELARRAKRGGWRIAFADGRHLVRTRAYRSVREIWWGYSKNTLDEARRQPLAMLVLPVLAIAPYVTLGWTLRHARGRSVSTRLVLAQAVLQVAAVADFGVGCARACAVSAGFGLAAPLAGLFLWLVVANAAVRHILGRPVPWKGRPLDLRL